jgi:hypothetical protein
VDQTATGLPLPPSILASYYAAAVAASGVDTSSAAAAAANGTPGSSGGSLGVGEGHGEGSIAGGNHMTVGTPPATRKRGRPRKPPTPYNCAFVGCQKQITKRRFCAAHQKRRERARKKAQQQQQIQSVGGQPTGTTPLHPPPHITKGCCRTFNSIQSLSSLSPPSWPLRKHYCFILWCSSF